MGLLRDRSCRSLTVADVRDRFVPTETAAPPCFFFTALAATSPACAGANFTNDAETMAAVAVLGFRTRAVRSNRRSRLVKVLESYVSTGAGEMAVMTSLLLPSASPLALSLLTTRRSFMRRTFALDRTILWLAELAVGVSGGDEDKRRLG